MKKRYILPIAALLSVIVLFAAACAGKKEVPGSAAIPQVDRSTLTVDLPPEIEFENLEGYKTAIFAGGCFWCMEPPFERLVGVAETVSGYTGGTKVNPTYEEVSYGETDHLEAVQVYYNPDIISYAQLLDVFWRNMDPTDAEGQFVDRGHQYTTGIFVQDAEQEEAARRSKESLAESGRFEKPIVTEIIPAGPFYRAEIYHQDYYEKDPKNYKQYRSGSGRDEFIEKYWKNDTMVEGTANVDERFGDFNKRKRLRELTDEQIQITQERGTEPAFENAYWDNKQAGIYVDVVSGEPLFSSTHKFDSGTGWPSFSRPIEPDNIFYRIDERSTPAITEVLSRYGESHLGHIFEDGPEPYGLRYCMNSAALRFVPLENLAEEGYGQYTVLFN